LKLKVSLTTAKRWMYSLGYHWCCDHRGQYVNRHECIDVVDPQMMEHQAQLCKWEKDGLTSELILAPGECQVQEWFHDKVTFLCK
ncbi:hypothetical protein F5141DRAFT_1004571, partial [Pisolithus sp. B1]